MRWFLRWGAQLLSSKRKIVDQRADQGLMNDVQLKQAPRQVMSCKKMFLIVPRRLAVAIKLVKRGSASYRIQKFREGNEWSSNKFENHLRSLGQNWSLVTRTLLGVNVHGIKRFTTYKGVQRIVPQWVVPSFNKSYQWGFVAKFSQSVRKPKFWMKLLGSEKRTKMQSLCKVNGIGHRNTLINNSVRKIWISTRF